MCFSLEMSDDTILTLCRVGPGSSISFDPPTCDDQKLEVPVEMFTVSYGLSVSAGTTVTTTTRTITETAWDTGCPIPEVTTAEACSINIAAAVWTEALESPPTSDHTTLPYSTASSQAVFANPINVPSRTTSSSPVFASSPPDSSHTATSLHQSLFFNQTAFSSQTTLSNYTTFLNHNSSSEYLRPAVVRRAFDPIWERGLGLPW